MKISDLLDYVDEILHNVFSVKTKLRWINQLEAEVQTEVLLLAAEGITQYTEEDFSAELLVPAPHDQIYQNYLMWQIALAQGEDRANNLAEQFNRVWYAYLRFVKETINPGAGMAEQVRYYLSAYQISVKLGYTGTEAEWIKSLRGKDGDPGATGAGLNIVDQVDTEADLPGNGTLKEGTGYLVGKGKEALLYIWNGKEWFYKQQLSGKGEPGEPGKPGKPGVVVSETEPTDPDATIWIDPSGEATPEINPGKDGREIELNVVNGYIVWRYVGDADWKNLIALSDLEGDPGAAATIEITKADALPAGSAPTVTENTGSTAQNRSYTIGIPAGRAGTNGRGVSSIAGNPDGSWTVTYTDGTAETVSSAAYTALKSKVDKAVLTDAMSLTTAQQAQVRANIAAAAAADLASYYRKNETYSQAEIDARISAIPKFSIKPVTALPTSEISATTVYLVKTAVQTNLYMEYIFVPTNSAAPGPFTDSEGIWEPLGAQTVDLTGYTTEEWVRQHFQPIGNYVSREEFDALTADVARIAVQIGNIDTALDEIISIQNSYINGGGAE